MKDYWICNKSQVADRTSKYDITHVLSALDPKERPFLHPKRPVVHKLFHFYDTEDAHAPFAPTREDVEKILQWTATLPDDAHLLVHCFAGMCRSTSMALLADLQKNYDPKVGWQPHWDKLLKKRDIAVPNRLILAYGLVTLGLQDIGLYEHVDAYVNRMILENRW